MTVTAKYIFDGQKLLEDKAVIISDNIIVEIVDKAAVGAPTEMFDYGECVLSAGLIDLQLNGCGGVSVNDSISFETLEQMHQTNLRFGTTQFLPTLVTSDFRLVIDTM